MAIWYKDEGADPKDRGKQSFFESFFIYLCGSLPPPTAPLIH